jgi:hypothetical protein
LKKQSVMKSVAILLSLSLSTTPLVAQERVGRHALIIGVSQYQNPDASPLKGVPYDIVSAGKIADAMGVPRSNQIVLQDDKADKASIIRELDGLAKRVSPGDRVLVYFSGHGTRWPDAQGKCMEGLYPYDGQSITHAELAQHISPLSKIADKLITIVDACHSGGVVAGKTRSLRGGELSAKFFSKGDSGRTQDCSKPTNFKARGLFDNVTRLGALQENTVEIAAALPDEQSWDDPGSGGLATQGIRDCLLGAARDLDGSGGINLSEIQQCAQKFVNDRVAQQPKEAGYLPHTITVLGNKNLIPVAVTKPPVQEPPKPPVVAIKPPEPIKPPVADPVKLPPVAPIAVVTPNPAPEPIKPQPEPPKPPAQAPAQTVAVVTPQPTVTTEPVKPIQVVEPPKPAPVAVKPPEVTRPPEPVKPPPEPPVPPPIASLATIKDVFAQRDPRFEVKATPAQTKIAIGKEGLKLTVQAKRDGYLYVVLLGSDRESFYLLYPNGYDSNNKIKANKPMTLPTPGWSVKAGGPAGKDELLVLVADSPRDLKALSLSEPTSAAPFTYALTDLGGRAALIDFLTGRGVQGRSESFGAAMFSIMEYEGTK